jgi:hypothetical protein
MSGWIGVDFDGTLAEYGTWIGPDHVGKPVGAMLFRVKKWLADGREVRIFTARAFPLGCIEPDTVLPNTAAADDLIVSREHVAAIAVQAIREWCREHLGQVLTVTCVKDYGMVELYDDRAVQVRMNTGELVGQSTRGLA